MLLPIGDRPNPRGIAPVTTFLIVANIAVFLLVTLPLAGIAPAPDDPVLAAYLRAIAQHLPAGVSLEQLAGKISAYDLVTFQYGYRPAAPRLMTLFTAMFLHGGLFHLGGNMLYLWIFGDNVEHRLGPAAFLFWYAATGVAATWSHGLLAPGSVLPMVGASGAISGVLGFYFVWFPRNYVRFLLLLPFVAHTFMMPAWIALGLYLLVDNVLPFLIAPAATGVAHGAHIGGFITGAVAAFLIRYRWQHRAMP